MSLRRDMLEIAKLAPRQLRDATARVEAFLLGQLHDDGGCKDREGRPDLYYTLFGLESLLALDAEIPAKALAAYARGFGAGDDLDLVHLACLVRCDAALSQRVLSEDRRREVIDRLARFRSDGGGYQNEPGDHPSTVYACFLALGAYQDLGADLPDPERTRDFIAGMETDDGGYANEPSMRMGSTAATAAAVAVLTGLDHPVRPSAARWLMDRAYEEGGFFAAPAVPMPDLLSTATALDALARLGTPLDPFREPGLDFLDSLWTPRGSFLAHWAETELDTEYTFYGLLALGHLGGGSDGA